VQKNWQLLPSDDVLSESLRSSLKINPVLCRILSQRGIHDYDQAATFFNPSMEALHSPSLMKDMHKAVSRIEKAILTQEAILIFGDYDVDGTTAVASMYQFIQSIHEPSLSHYYIPHRYKEGYGVSKAGIDFAKAQNCSLIICLDCGIKSVELVQYAKSLGIDFIICDHHLPGHELPDATAILNPKQSDCPYPYKELCGCGIGFKLMSALALHFNLEKDTYERYLDLVCLAIAADIVPMTGENRILAHFGLQQINTNPSEGIRSLITLSGLQKSLNISNVVFMLAPRINAAGRMDDAKLAVQLFIEKDKDEALRLAHLLQQNNSERKEADQDITHEAIEMIASDIALQQKKSCVLFRPHWHKGVVGIVASRVIEQYYRPTIILTQSDGIVTGSARSIKGFNVYEAIYACKDDLLAFGGHFAAAGLSMLPEKVAAFADQFERIVCESVTDEMLVPEITIDAELSLEEINPTFFRIINRMEPFGPENMKPVFMVRGIKDSGYSKLVKENHIRFDVVQKNIRMNGIGFGMKDKFDIVKSGQPFDMVFTIEENEWNGTVTLQLQVKDIR
jgi:single-stranded-DNA-specific exonuclease